MGWWTTDHTDDADPALFERAPDGTILNSYSSYVDPGEVAVVRTRGVVLADGFLFGVGSDNACYKVDPDDGTVVSSFTVGSSNNALLGIAYNGTNLFIVDRGGSASIDAVAEYTLAGSLVGTHSFPSGRSLTGLTWDGANFWATTSGGQIIRMGSTFNETLSIPGPPGTDRGCQFRDGYLYVMTDQGLYRKPV